MAVALTRLSRIGAASLGAAVVVVATAGMGVAHAHKTVTVSIDGATRTVSTYQTTPASVLADAGVRLSPHDRVDAPAGLSSGDTIAVTTASRAVLPSQAGPTPAWVATPTTLEAAKEVARHAASALPLGRTSALVQKDLGVSGRLILVHDGLSQEVEVAKGQSASDVVRAAGLTLAPLDRLTLDVSGATPTLTVVRVTRSADVTEEVSAHTTREVTDDSLPVGTRTVETPGTNGVTRTASFSETVDGQVVFHKAGQPTEMTAMVEKVVRVGTKRPEPASAPTPGQPAADLGSAPNGSVWAALAQCESGGNPAAVSSNGLYHGLYQFSVSTWRAVGGSGLPSQASAAEQTQRAQALQARSGWGQWPACSRKLGLR